LSPDEFGLGDYAESQPSMPLVSDEVRYYTRDVVAQQVLQQLSRHGAKIDEWTDYEANAQKLVLELVSAPATLPPAVRKQFERSQLFTDDAETRSPDESAAQGHSPSSKNLLGKFDCMAIPVRADYDASFAPLATAPSPGAAEEGGAVFLDDCDGPNCFAGWFFVLHVGAPNIGESDQADDFHAYAKQEWGNDSAEPTMRLDEGMYLEDVQRLWRNAIIAMGRLGVDHGVFFPFGMGAFLRQLGERDNRYRDSNRMRRLRRRIADQLMLAIRTIYSSVDRGDAGTQTSSPSSSSSDPPRKPGAPDAIKYPRHLHLCLICVSAAESIENHNVFIEAAGQYVKTMPFLSSLLQIRRNVDVLQLAHSLASDIQEPLNVAILNAANRKMLGNHWFQRGGIIAIDENLHRRSVSMARAALLLNTGVVPRERRPTELSEAVQLLGGRVTQLIDDSTAAVAVLDTRQGRGSRLWCCRRRAPAHAQPAADVGAESAAPVSRSQSGRSASGGRRKKDWRREGSSRENSSRENRSMPQRPGTPPAPARGSWKKWDRGGDRGGRGRSGSRNR